MDFLQPVYGGSESHEVLMYNSIKPKIILLVPHHSEQIYTKAALSIMAQSIYCDQVIFPESRSENLATIRNGLVEQAFKVAPDLTHILWLDGDQVFPRDMVPRLLEHDKDIVGAWVNIRQNLKANVYKILYQNKRGGFKHRSYTKKEINKFIADGQPLQKVERFGFGSLLIKRKVWETMPRPWFWFDEHHACEDLYFCDKARENGFEMYVDWSLRSLHISLTYV